MTTTGTVTLYPISPSTVAQILDDSIFLLYGGQTGTSSSAVRDVAYLLAEAQMEDYLSSYLLPTEVSETYFWKGGNPINLKHGNINSVSLVTVDGINTNNSCAIETVTGCHAVRGDGKYGYIDISYLLSCGGCSSILGLPPYNVNVTYNSGLPSGTAYGVSMLQALTLAAQINLNELDVSLSNEGTADIGITQFTNQKYSEIRMKLGNTAFGNSPMANRVTRLVRKYRTKPSIGFH